MSDPLPAGAAAAATVRRIAVLRPNHRIGNTLLLTPLMQELEMRFPAARVELVTAGGAAVPVFARYPRIAVQAFPGQSYRHPLAVVRLLLRLRQAQYDLAIDPTVRSRAGRFLLKFVRARRRIGYAWGNGGADRVLTDAVDPRGAPLHHAEVPPYLLRTALDGHGAPGSSEAWLPLDLRLSDEERAEGSRQLATALGSAEPGGRPVVGLYAFATGAKCLPPEWWRTLARTLQAQAPWLQLIEFLAEDGHSRIGEGVRATYTPGLRMLGAKLAATSLVVIGDGGILHLADAAGARVLGLFRTTAPAQYAPRRPGSQALQGIDEEPGSVAARIVAMLAPR
jgi:heptosyltransferase-3